MAKFCIFCGSPPENKNKEHVVPKWLMELTGDPNRKAFFGFDRKGRISGQRREFAFSKFTFPACEQCNDEYADLEGKAKVVISLVLRDSPIDSTEATTLLDWLDKVRVGLWLGYHQLDKNQLDIDPNFHINKRIGQYDRLLISEKTDYIDQRLSFCGVDTPAFGFTPSVFSITINHYCLTNISFNFLFARRIGFPYPTQLEMTEKGGFQCNIEPARGRVMKPLIPRAFNAKGPVIYQPMFPQKLMSAKSAEYDSLYVREHSIDFKSGIGKIMLEERRNEVRWLEPDERFSISPSLIQDAHQQHIESVINVLEWQNWINEGTFSTNNITPEFRRFVRDRQNFAKRVNKMMITHHEHSLGKYGYST